MSKRTLIAALSVLVATVLAASAAGATPQMKITEASGNGFPGRSYILTLSRQLHIKAGDVSVTENGQAVDGLLVTSVGATASGQSSAAVLLIDASTSMEGAPEKAALAGARAFAAQRKGEQQLGVVTYNASPTVVLPLTTDAVRIDEALNRQPPFVYGTHIYDAVVRSLEMLAASKIKAGSIVVLSDGQEAPSHGETGSHDTEQTAAAAARAAHVRVFTVGLRSRLSKLGALKKLAADTGGRYVETKRLQELTRIYNNLGSQLASEYLLRYRSLARAGVHVEVRARVTGLDAVATSAYDTPKLQVLTPTAKPPYTVSLSHRLWTSSVMAVFVGLLGAGLIGLGTYSLLSGPKKGTVRKRMAEFVSMPTAIGERRARTSTQITGKMFESTENVLKGSGWWRKFRWELEIAQVKTPPEQIIVLTVVGSALAFAFVGLFLSHVLVGVILALAIPFGVRSLLRRDLAKKRDQFAQQLPDNLQVLSSALRAGHSFVGALSVVVNDAPEPARSEFQRVIADEQLGVPIDQAMHVVVERMDNRELEQVALVAALQRESGGNTAEVLDRVTDTIRERFELRRTVQTLTAQGRMSRWVLTMLPVALFSFVSLVNPGYMHVLYSSVIGKVLLVFAAISVTAGSFVIKRIVNIKV